MAALRPDTLGQLRATVHIELCAVPVIVYSAIETECSWYHDCDMGHGVAVCYLLTHLGLA